MRRRFARGKGFILLLFAVIFSFGILGQVDTRMHIGGSDWDLDSLIYINVDEYLYYSTLDSQEYGQPLPTVQTLAALDGAAKPVETPQPQVLDEGTAEALPEVAEQPEPTAPSRVESALQVATPPVAAPPKVEEKKEEERPTIFVHKVNPGETLWDIANAYGVSVDAIISANELKNPNMLAVGQELNILSVQGVLHKVATGESLWEISQRYQVPMEEITRVNNITDPARIMPNTKLIIPGATQLRPKDVLLVNGQLQRAFDWPVTGRISSPFGPRWGRMHNGLDIAVNTGTPVRAAADGRVTFAGWNGGYGILVIVDHGNNVETRYAHNSRLNVKVGQSVTRGQVIAYSGNTGNSTGPHVHFEIRYRGNPVNPQSYLK
ncbi:MAG TPA: peptidoglycan DD-metalloendopeptidase family protein [Limnochordia bacterium]|nr:peptidoglycan DD-metalloendopeptidase family protein [Limnochordia bacterium]